MSIDYYICDSCGFNYDDLSESVASCDCGAAFCSVSCGKMDNAYEHWDEIEDGTEVFPGDPINPDKPTTCVVCRKETHTTQALLEALLKHFNLSEEDAIKIWKNEK